MNFYLILASFDVAQPLCCVNPHDYYIAAFWQPMNSSDRDSGMLTGLAVWLQHI